jgi:DNA-binding transcriptional ArsR family regulator
MSAVTPHADEAFPERVLSAELADMMHNARRASDMLKAMSHESRLLLLCLLSERERTVGELETALSMRQSAVSQQLARLRLDGLVSARREGKAVYYSIASPDVRRVIDVVYDIFCGNGIKTPHHGS